MGRSTRNTPAVARAMLLQVGGLLSCSPWGVVIHLVSVAKGYRALVKYPLLTRHFGPSQTPTQAN